jgi:hypothetical protein
MSSSSYVPITSDDYYEKAPNPLRVKANKKTSKLIKEPADWDEVLWNMKVVNKRFTYIWETGDHDRLSTKSNMETEVGNGTFLTNVGDYLKDKTFAKLFIPKEYTWRGGTEAEPEATAAAEEEEEEEEPVTFTAIPPRTPKKVDFLPSTVPPTPQKAPKVKLEPEPIKSADSANLASVFAKLAEMKSTIRETGVDANALIKLIQEAQEAGDKVNSEIQVLQGRVQNLTELAMKKEARAQKQKQRADRYYGMAKKATILFV